MSRFYDDLACLEKPLQAGTTWPTLVSRKMALVVPDGGKCFGCKTDVSGKVAKYVFDKVESSLKGYEAAVSCLLYTSPSPRDS